MTNEQLALLLDPRREKPGWWKHEYVVENARQRFTGDVTFRGPNWHRSDIECFRDWRPVLLAAGWFITEALSDTSVQDDAGVTMEVEDTYRAAILAAVAWLAEHEPTLLRGAIARVEGAANG